MSQPIYQVDAFTDKPFGGNPAGVCILNEPADEVWMQNVAMEMNLSETAFLDPTVEGFKLRWFTPTIEVDLCGHATLASSHILWEQGILKPDQEARFHTKSGLLTAAKHGPRIYLNFPATPAIEETAPDGLLEALDVKPVFVGKTKFDYFIEVESEKIVRGIHPDFEAIRRLEARGVVVTAKAANPAFDFVSRYFAPAFGVNEDPATGSTHCALAPYWETKLGKMRMTGYQASRRGGLIRVERLGDRVILGGQAVTVLRGEMA